MIIGCNQVSKRIFNSCFMSESNVLNVIESVENRCENLSTRENHKEWLSLADSRKLFLTCINFGCPQSTRIKKIETLFVDVLYSSTSNKVMAIVQVAFIAVTLIKESNSFTLVHYLKGSFALDFLNVKEYYVNLFHKHDDLFL